MGRGRGSAGLCIPQGTGIKDLLHCTHIQLLQQDPLQTHTHSTHQRTAVQHESSCAGLQAPIKCADRSHCERLLSYIAWVHLHGTIRSQLIIHSTSTLICGSELCASIFRWWGAPQLLISLLSLTCCSGNVTWLKVMPFTSDIYSAAYITCTSNKWLS